MQSEEEKISQKFPCKLYSKDHAPDPSPYDIQSALHCQFVKGPKLGQALVSRVVEKTEEKQ
jgi:hypothetical protein